MTTTQYPPKTKESVIQTHIKHYLMYKGWFVFKNHQSLGSHKGVADLYAIKNGMSLWIEIKTPTGRLSQDQIQFKADIEEHGGKYIVARSIEEIEAHIKKLQ